jgi:hypothetical protein
LYKCRRASAPIFNDDAAGRNLAGVSVAASTLQRAGMITYNGAELVILDREQLEAVACSCYWIVRRQAGKVSQSRKVL